MCNTLKLATGGLTPAEYAEQIQESLETLLLLVFERRHLDLSESQCFALHTITRLQGKLYQTREVHAFRNGRRARP